MGTKGIFLSWIVVKDLQKAIEFYTTVAGLQLKEYAEEFGWAELAGPEGSILGIAQESPEHGQVAGKNAVVTISVDDIHSACERFGEHAKLVGELIEIPGHVKMQTFEDKDGNTLQIVQTMHG